LVGSAQRLIGPKHLLMKIHESALDFQGQRGAGSDKSFMNNKLPIAATRTI
jgi:hypothetical protein